MQFWIINNYNNNLITDLRGAKVYPYIKILTVKSGWNETVMLK